MTKLTAPSPYNSPKPNNLSKEIPLRLPLRRRLLFVCACISTRSGKLDSETRVLGPRKTVELDIVAEHLTIVVDLLVADAADAVLRGGLGAADAVEFPEEDQ